MPNYAFFRGNNDSHEYLGMSFCRDREEANKIADDLFECDCDYCSCDEEDCEESHECECYVSTTELESGTYCHEHNGIVTLEELEKKHYRSYNNGIDWRIRSIEEAKRKIEKFQKEIEELELSKKKIIENVKVFNPLDYLKWL
jgi:hypothetical protein